MPARIRRYSPAPAWLDGSHSTDVDGDLLTYRWMVVSAPDFSAAQLTDAASAMASFMPDLVGSYRLVLVVNDGTVDSAADAVTIVTSPGNSAPVADAGPDQSLPLGATAFLDGGASHDSDGRIRQIVFDLAQVNARRESLGLDDPQQDLESIRFVVSNHLLSGGTADTGVPITASASPCQVKWVGTAVFDTQYKFPPHGHIRTRADVTWTRDESSPFGLVGIDLFVPSGSGTVEIFEANGCVATVTPPTMLIDPIAGQLRIDYNTTPNTADGYGSISIVATLTDCDGHVQPGTPLGIMFMANGPFTLNDNNDTFVQHIVVADDVVSLITLDLNYKRFLVPSLP